jgi:hypothetical protein
VEVSGLRGSSAKETDFDSSVNLCLDCRANQGIQEFRGDCMRNSLLNDLEMSVPWQRSGRASSGVNMLALIQFD